MAEQQNLNTVILATNAKPINKNVIETATGITTMQLNTTAPINPLLATYPITSIEYVGEDSDEDDSNTTEKTKLNPSIRIISTVAIFQNKTEMKTDTNCAKQLKIQKDNEDLKFNKIYDRLLHELQQVKLELKEVSDL